MQEKLKQLLPYLLPVVIIAVVSAVYFYPAFSGNSLVQSDIRQFKGMAQETMEYRKQFDSEPYWTNSMFGGMPSYQITAIYDSALRQVTQFFQLFFPRPAGYFFLYGLGFYILLLAMGANKWLSTIGALGYAFSTYFIIILEAGHNTKAHAIGYMAPALAGLILTYKGREKLGAAVLLLFLSLQIFANHLQITYYMGLIFLFYIGYQAIKSFQDKDFKPFIRSSVISGAVLLVALLVNSANLFNTMSYTKATTRGTGELTIKPDGTSNGDIATSGLDKQYATAWSYGIEESLSLFVPNVKGGGSGSIINSQEDFAKYKDPQLKAFINQVYGGQMPSFGRYIKTYWGEQSFTSGPVYIGAAIFYLFLLAMFFIRGKWRWAIFGVTLLSLLLSWGKNFMPLSSFFLDYIPGYNKFRAVSMTLVILELTIPLLAFVGIKELIEKPDYWAENKKKFYAVSVGFIGVLFILLAFPDGLLNFTSSMEEAALNNEVSRNPQIGMQVQQSVDALKDLRISVFRGDLLRTLFIVALSALLIWFRLEKNLKLNYFLVGLGIIVVADLAPVNKRYLNNEKQQGKFLSWEPKDANAFPFTPSAADMQILEMERRESAQVNEAITNATANLTKEEKRNQNAVYAAQFSALNFATDYRVLNLSTSTFNDATTSYYHKSIGGYHGAKLQRYQDLIEFHFSQGVNPAVINMLNTKYVIQQTQQGVMAIKNPDALGNAWFVNNVEWVANADEEIMALKDLDPSKTAVVDERFKSVVTESNLDTNASIRLISYLPNELQYISNSTRDQFAVFSEIYYADGWQAYLDGTPVEHARVNYVLRGMNIPAGQHEVIFKFEPQGVQMGNMVSLIGGILMLLAVAYLLYASLKESQTSNEEA